MRGLKRFNDFVEIKCPSHTEHKKNDEKKTYI